MTMDNVVKMLEDKEASRLKKLSEEWEKKQAEINKANENGNASGGMMGGMGGGLGGMMGGLGGLTGSSSGNSSGRLF